MGMLSSTSAVMAARSARSSLVGSMCRCWRTNTLTAATRPARRRDLRQIVEAGDRRQGRQRRGPGYLALAAVGCNAPGRQLQVQLGLSKLTVITPLALRAKCVTSWPTTLEPSGANTRIVRVNVVLEFLSLRLKFPHAVACPV